MFTETFWLDSLSNLIATIIGIAIGLPIAFWLDRISRERNDKEKEKEIKRNLQKILSILLTELDENIFALRQLHSDVINFYHPVQMESWRAFSDGGELKWIHDPALINKLTLAYGSIGNYKFVLENYYDSYVYLVRTNNVRWSEPQFNTVRRFRDIASKSVTEAHDFLKGHLEKITK